MQQQAGTAQIRITIPNGGAAASSSHRGRQFVGADVAGANIGVAAHGSTSIVTTAFDLSAGSTLCTTSGGVRACTLSIAAPIGNDDFFVQTFDAAPVGGAIPSSAHLLGQASLPNITVAGSGTPAPVSITVLGQVNSITAVASGQITFPGDGAAHTTTLIVSGYDFGNIPISGTYSNPITVTVAETGGTGHTQLTLNGSPSGTSATLASSADTLGLSYDGGGSAGYYATVSLSASGATTHTFNVVPMYVSSTSPYYTAANGLQFTASGQTAQLTISEAVGNSNYTVTTSTAGGCGSAATASPVTGSGSSARVAVTSGASPASGCPLGITDAVGAVSLLHYSTTLTSGGVTIGGITEYTIPGSNLRLTGIVAGTDGNIYTVETIGNPAGTNHIDQISTSGVLTNQFTIPTANANPNHLAVAADGTIWFAEGGSIKIGKMALPGGTFTEYQEPSFPSGLPQAISIGTDGYIYYLDRGTNSVYQMTPQGNTLSTMAFTGGSAPQPYAIATGSDGNLYVTDSANDQIVVINPCCNPSYEPLASTGTDIANIIGAPNGQMWFTEPNVNKIGNVATGIGTPVDYATGSTDQPAGLTVGPDGNIWICAPGSNEILKFDVSSLSVTQRYLIPTASASPYGITTGPDGRIWFTEFSTNKVGVLTP